MRPRHYALNHLSYGGVKWALSEKGYRLTVKGGHLTEHLDMRLSPVAYKNPALARLSQLELRSSTVMSEQESQFVAEYASKSVVSVFPQCVQY